MRGKLFVDLVAMTLAGVLFILAAILKVPGNIVFAVARKLFELCDEEESAALPERQAGERQKRESAAGTHTKEANTRSHGGGR